MSDQSIRLVAEEIMPGAVLAQIKKLGAVGALHRPMAGVPGSFAPACAECFGGIFAVDPAASRPCGCWGLVQPFCATCHGNGHWARPKWPCETWKALIRDE